MQKITQSLPAPAAIRYTDYIDRSQTVFFDIETTGLSAATSYLYLIGCVYWEGDQLSLIQWFSEDISEEEELLRNFTEWVKAYCCLVHFNGTTFDIPYLAAKCRKYELDFDFNALESVDIYKRIFPYRKYFPLPNARQKTFESFLGLKREDIFSGGDLIPVYTAYLGRSRYERFHKGDCGGKCPRPEELAFLLASEGKLPDVKADVLKKFLLCHNREDVENLPALLSLLSYTEFFKGRYEFENGKRRDGVLELTMKPVVPFPAPLSFQFPLALKTETACYCTLTLESNRARLEIPVYAGEVRFYYENYKDYYFLTEEGIISHKSVAEFVSKEYRRKAKAEECFYRKNGYFLPQPEVLYTPAFRREYRQKFSYFELTEERLADPDFAEKYARYLLANFVMQKPKAPAGA